VVGSGEKEVPYEGKGQDGLRRDAIPRHRKYTPVRVQVLVVGEGGGDAWVL